MKKSSVLVTGAAGVMGARLVSRLRRAGHQVRALVLGDGLEETTVVEFDPAPDRLDQDSAEWDLELAPGHRCMLFARVATSEDAPSGRTFLGSMRAGRPRSRSAN